MYYGTLTDSDIDNIAIYFDKFCQRDKLTYVDFETNKKFILAYISLYLFLTKSTIKKNYIFSSDDYSTDYLFIHDNKPDVQLFEPFIAKLPSIINLYIDEYRQCMYNMNNRFCFMLMVLFKLSPHYDVFNLFNL